ncbi:MAG: urate hydroxylase PuuD [Ignavibacteria bacterium]|nr:urate hydroxylase PuuD [Ignavibacteria bacterium]
MEDIYFNLSEWLNLAARWIHVFAGIMWVGQTYFFTWLDGRFSEMTADNAVKNPDEHVWMVHSGGFYVVGKQPRPQHLPKTLHWFKWEAAMTWLSGITLLILVYYAGGLMVNEHMEENTAIVIGISLIVVSWFIYDMLWRSKLAKREMVGACISYALLVLVSFGLTHIMEGRAAYMHVGAMLGTLMTANVWLRILPAQRTMVAALHEGKEPDLMLAARAKMRSKHNTFMAVPVVFIMISNHYPVTSYGDSWNWVILSVLIVAGWGAAKIIRRA